MVRPDSFPVLCLPHFLCVSRGEQLSASHFMDLRSAFPGWIWVGLCKSPLGAGGVSKRERQRGGDQSLSHKLQSVSQSSAITRDSEDILPDTRGCRPNAAITERVIYF